MNHPNSQTALPWLALSQGLAWLKRHPVACLMVVLFCVVLVPLWACPYFPSQDGPIHLYSAWIYNQLDQPDAVYLKTFFHLNTDLPSNWFCQFALAQLMRWWPPLVAEKVFISGYLLLFLISFHYYLNAFKPTHWLWSICGFLLCYNYLLMMGFYNHLIAFSLGLLAMGFWIRRRHKPLLLPHIIWFYLLMGSSVIVHPFPFTILMVLLLLFQSCQTLWPVITQLQSHISTTPLPRQPKPLMVALCRLCYQLVYQLAIGEPLSRLVVLLLPLLAVIYKFQGFYWLHQLRYLGDFIPLPFLLKYFFINGSFYYLSDAHIGFSLAFWVLILLALQFTIITKIQTRQWLETKDWALGFALIVGVLFFILPFGFNQPSLGFSFINQRLHFMGWVLLFGWFQMPQFQACRRWMGLYICIILLGFTALLTYEFRLLGQELNRLIAPAGLMRPHSTFEGVMTDYTASRYFSTTRNYAPFAHVFSYLPLVNEDVVELTEFGHGAADLIQSSLPKFYQHVIHPDYRLHLGPRSVDQEQDYKALGGTERLNREDTLLLEFPTAVERALPSPPLLVWFTDGSTLPKGFTPWQTGTQSALPSTFTRLTVSPHDRYTPSLGKGWLKLDTTVSSTPVPQETPYIFPKVNHFSGTQGGVLDQPLTGRRPQTLLLEVPNGTYLVTAYFSLPNHLTTPFITALKANGRSVADPFTLYPGQFKTVQYHVLVDHGTLSQTVYTPFDPLASDPSQHWVWSGFLVSPITQKR